MSFAFTIYQEGKMVDNSTGSLMPLDAAINLKDFEMVKLLVSYKAPICNDQSLGQCSLTNAANRGYHEIYQYLKPELVKESKSEGLEVRFWSDKADKEKAEICKRSNQGNPKRYDDCMKMKEYLWYYRVDSLAASPKKKESVADEAEKNRTICYKKVLKELGRGYDFYEGQKAIDKCVEDKEYLNP